jgi:hypothetical protein
VGPRDSVYNLETGKSLAAAMVRITDRPTPSLVTIMSRLLRGSVICKYVHSHAEKSVGGFFLSPEQEVT